jgi:hypothetical protein
MPTPPDPAGAGRSHQTAGKLAQLLGETIIHHSPVTSAEQAAAQRRETDRWLEGLEQHLAGLVGPFLQQILDNSDPPEPVRALLEEAIHPTAQFTAVIEQIFVFGIVSQLLGASVQPFLQGVTNALWPVAVGQGITVPLSVPTLATAIGRGIKLGDKTVAGDYSWAYPIAAESGVSNEELDLQASLIGLPPALQELFEMYRRGILDNDPSGMSAIDLVKQGLKEGDFRDDWIDRTVQLAHAYLTPLDFVRAAVQGQMAYTDAQAWAYRTGLDTNTGVPITAPSPATNDMFGLAYSIAGRPPGPQEMARMAQRGIINWDGFGADQTTFQQGIAESDIKNKWKAALQALAVYLPPPAEIGSLYEKGGIDQPTAETLWSYHGVPANLVTAYEYVAQQQHVLQDKLEAKNTVLTAYFDQLLTNPQATALLSDLGFRGPVAAEMLAVQDFKREIRAINNVVSRISSLYENHKLTAAGAQNALVQVGVDPGLAGRILGHLDAVRGSPIHLPTASEIGLAYKHGTIDEPTALAALGELGYQPRDAAIVLSAHATVLVTPLPPPGTTITG